MDKDFLDHILEGVCVCAYFLVRSQDLVCVLSDKKHSDAYGYLPRPGHTKPCAFTELGVVGYGGRTSR